MARDLAGNGDGQERLYSRRKEDRNGRMRTDDACGRTDPMRSPLNAGNGDKQCGDFRAAVDRALPYRWNMQACPSLSTTAVPSQYTTKQATATKNELRKLVDVSK